MTKISIATAEGEVLARITAMAQGFVQISEYYWKDAEGDTATDGRPYRPDLPENGQQTMELVREFKIATQPTGFNQQKEAINWRAWMPSKMGPVFECQGPTPEIAICRAVCASKYGDEVDIDE